MNATETKYISFTEAAKLVPQGSPTMIWRWARCGLKCVDGTRMYLQHARVGGRLYTTAEWVDEFTRHLAEADMAARKARAGV